MRPYFLERFGNASSIHQQGQQARAAVEQAREHVAALLHCRPTEVVFTSGGTESDNLALFGLLSPGDQLITTRTEHHAVLNSAEALEKLGVHVTWLRSDERGIIQPDTLRAALESASPIVTPHRRLVSIIMANNETGVIQPISQLAFIAHQFNAIFHTDAVQAAGKIPIDVKALNVDLLSIAGHKMHAPLGTGALFVRRGIQLRPIFHGGAHERRRRAGTENLPGIVGLGKAVQLASDWLESDGPEQIAALRDRLEQGILVSIPQTGINAASPTGNIAARVPNTTNIWFDHVEGEALVIALDLKGISVSGGSACSSGAVEPSHVLLSMGLSQDRARASLRFSLSKQNTAAEVDALLAILPDAVARLRTLSPKMQRREAEVAV
jgi:cysteine desulfurase